jgi:serine/threonine protein kinase/Flp pilus assembly protein TadD
MMRSFEDAIAKAYRIERELGRGGMATVYLGQDMRHNRRVAIKVLHPELGNSIGPDRFLREIELAARLNHPHIVPLFDSGNADGFLYYVMPVVEGETLRDRLLRDGQIPIDESLQLTRGIAAALDYAHRQNVVHRDIKPENIMLQDGEAVVMDFGIGKAVSSAANDTLTQTGTVVGTPAYVSPEQAAGENKIDGRSDQYSLACVLFEMLSGKKAFTGPTAQSVISKRFTDPVPSLRAAYEKTPDEVENAMRKALAKDASDRFATTAEFARALMASTLTTPEGSSMQGASGAKSIAVLPFTNMSADPEGDFLGDGIADEIITALSKVKALRVVSRTSSFTFKGKNDDIREIGRKLQVSTVLEGSIRKAGKKLRLNAQLVSTSDSSQLWAERYDRELEDVFAIQDEIASNIVAALRVVLSEDEKKAIENVPTTNIDAYEYYLRGRQFFYQHRRRSHEFARQLFERAIELDPGYALAHCGVADCCSLLYQYFDATQGNLNRADNASRRALELAPHLAEAHASRGLALSVSGKFGEAQTEFQEAVRLNPKSFEAAYFYARSCSAEGKYEDAVKWYERAVQVRPEDFAALLLLSNAYKAVGRIEDATRASRRAYDAARKHLDLNPDNPRALNMGASALANLGEYDKALDWNRRAEEMEAGDPSISYNAACVYARLNMPHEAIKSLTHALDHGFGHWTWIENDTAFAPIRQEPEFVALLTRKPVSEGQPAH